MRDQILITEADYDRLQRLIEARRLRGPDAGHIKELERELDRAEIVDTMSSVPPDVITMNSEVRLMDVDSGEIKVYKLVFPSEAGSGNALSVLAPIGTAILGYRTGSIIEWPVPRGVRRLKVLEVLFQPEAAAGEGLPPAA
jgi:regulator of nucleoside diphosphate kinase